jgi:hypothetical protein
MARGPRKAMKEGVTVLPVPRVQAQDQCRERTIHGTRIRTHHAQVPSLWCIAASSRGSERGRKAVLVIVTAQRQRRMTMKRCMRRTKRGDNASRWKSRRGGTGGSSLLIRRGWRLDPTRVAGRGSRVESTLVMVMTRFPETVALHQLHVARQTLSSKKERTRYNAVSKKSRPSGSLLCWGPDRLQRTFAAQRQHQQQYQHCHLPCFPKGRLRPARG